MDSNVAYILKVLQTFFDPASPPSVKSELEAGLAQFKGREDAWRLAVHVLQGESRGEAQEPYLLWYSASLLQESLSKGWSAIPEETKAGLRECLVQFMLRDTGTGRLPPFASNKLAVVCANIARQDWPQAFPTFLHHLEAGLAVPEARSGALLLLSVAVEQFEAVAPDAPGREAGAVLWSRAEELHRLLEPVYPGLLSALVSALQAEAESGSCSLVKATQSAGPTELLAAITKVLGGSKGSHSTVLKRAASGPGTESLLSALYHFAAPSHQSSDTAVAALACMGILADAALPAGSLHTLVGTMLHHLNSFLEAAQGIQLAFRQGQGPGLDAWGEWWLAVVRLIATLIDRHGAAVLFGAELAKYRPMLQNVLDRAASVTFAVPGSALHAMVSCEVWRALAAALSMQQDLCWENPDPQAALATWEAATSAGIQDMLVGIADVLISGMVGRDGAGIVCPSISCMDRTQGSGLQLREAIAAASVSDVAFAQADDAWGDDAFDGGMYTEDANTSEADTYAEASESLVGQLVGLFPGSMVPRCLDLLLGRISALEHSLATSQHQIQTSCTAVRELSMAVRLATRCACHLPVEGPGAVESAAAVDSVFRLVEAWPAARSRLAAASGGDQSSVDQLGVHLFKLSAALEAVWLPKAAVHKVASNVSERAWNAVLNCATAVAKDAKAQEPGPTQIPACVLESAFEMLAVLASVSRTSAELEAARPPDNSLHLLVEAAPILLLRHFPREPSKSGSLRISLRAGQGLYRVFTDLLLCKYNSAEGNDAIMARAQAVLGPLVTILEGALSGGTPAEVVEQVCAVLSSIVHWLKTSCRAVRETVYQGVFFRTVGACITVSKRCQEVMVSTDPGEATSLPASKMAEALQELAATIVDTFSSEMGTSGVEELLKCTIQIYSIEGKDGVDGWSLFCNGTRAKALLHVVSRCAMSRCCSKLQVLATLGFLFALWDQIMEGFSSNSDETHRRGRGHGMKDLAADLGALAAQVINASADIIRDNWQGFVGKDFAGSSQGYTAAVAAAMAGMAARHGKISATTLEGTATAAAAEEQQKILEAGKVSGPGAALRLLDMISDLVGAASVQSCVSPSPQDLQLALHSFLDLEDQVQLSCSTHMHSAFPKLLDCLMQLLSTTRYSSIETDIVEVLYVTAAADWKSFMEFLPRRMYHLPAVLYAGDSQQQQHLRASVLLQPFSGTKPESSEDFARSMKRFLNDAKYFQAQRIVL